MRFRYFLIGLTSLLFAVSTPTLAIDRNGNYTVHDFFPTKDEYALSTWKVVAAHLNCRKRPENTDKILRVFHQGSALTAQTSEGSHDNVGFLQMDAQGKPWMRALVQPSAGLNTCFVRAHRAYIRPVVEQR
jgi:hypothetical protein